MKRETTAFIAAAPLAIALIAAGAAMAGVANSPLGRTVVGSEGRTLDVFQKDK